MANKNLTVAVANAKGGAGKSTITCCIAAELHQRGRLVKLIDADPLGGTKAWHDAGGRLSEIPLITEATERVTKTALEAARESTVLIDAAGFATTSLVAVLEAADLVLIPCRPSALDAFRAIETAQLADDVAKAARRRITVRTVLNGVNNAAIVPHIRAELEAAGLDVTKAQIGQRTAFAVAALTGSAPCWMGYSATQAAHDVAELVDELDI